MLEWSDVSEVFTNLGDSYLLANLSKGEGLFSIAVATLKEEAFNDWEQYKLGIAFWIAGTMYKNKAGAQNPFPRQSIRSGDSSIAFFIPQNVSVTDWEIQLPNSYGAMLAQLLRGSVNIGPLSSGE